jgi:hypothetical protein
MMAFQLGALEEDEMALIRGRLETDADWKKARDEAQAMLIGLSDDGPVRAEVPHDLGGRTIQRLRSERITPPTPPSQGGEERVTPIATSIGGKRAKPSPWAWRVAAAIFFACAIPVGWLSVTYFFQGGGGESILWRADSKLAAGTPFAPFVLVRDAQTQAPQSNVHLASYLVQNGNKIPIGESVTDKSGIAVPPHLEKGAPGGSAGGWHVPDVAAGNYKLVIEARSSFGSVLDHVERDVQVTRSAHLALAPDRTQARPGETIRARTLLVSQAGEKPLADQNVTIDLLDPTGNRIGREEKKSTKFGLAWAEFPLDSAAPEGTYKLLAECSGMKVERTVEVKQYKLPPFQVTINLFDPWLAPTETVKAEIRAKTFDGHPVVKAKGEAKILGANGKVLATAPVELDEGFAMLCRGSPEGELPIKETGETEQRLVVTLTDPAGRSASGQATIHVSDKPLIITAVPEAGQLIQGLENIVYVIARTPDGKPVESDFLITEGTGPKHGSEQRIHTDTNGIGRFSISNPRLPAEVRTIWRVNRAWRESDLRETCSLPVQADSRGKLLVRMNKAVCSAGDVLDIEVFAGPPLVNRTFNVALRQDGQTITSAAASDNRQEVPPGATEDFKRLPFTSAKMKLIIPNGVTGVLSVEASSPSAPGQYWTDSRTILVNGSSNVRVVASADKPKYRPGERARLDFAVTDTGGAGIPAAVSVVGVDDALLALTGEHPGLAQALQQAGVNVFRAPNAVLDPASIAAEDGGKDVAHAALASVRAPEEKSAHASEFVDTSAEKLATAERERAVTAGLLKQFVMLLLVVGCAVFIVAKSARDSVSAVRAAVPLLTVLICGIGLFGASVLNQEWQLFGLFAYATMLISHIILLSLSGARSDDKFDNSSFGAATILSDLGLGGLALLAANAPHHEAGFVTFMFVIGIVGALFLQLNFSRPERDRAIPLYVFKFAGLGLLMFVIMTVLFVGSVRYKVQDALRKKDGPWVVTASAPPMDSKMKSVSGIERDFDGPIMENGPLDLGYEMTKSPGSYDASSPIAPPHLRFDFPETMIFAPQVVTDETGHASYALNVADSLTSWRVQTDAIAASGGTGWTQCSLVVTQAFSVDLSLPTDVTAGDELTVPAVVSNHTENARDVVLLLEVTGATALDGLPRTVHVGGKSVAAADFRLKFESIGKAKLKVTALPSSPPTPLPPVETGDESDAVERELRVLPDGEPVAFSSSMLINDDGTFDVAVPENSLPGTISATLRLHRGPLTQMIEGLESMLQEPNGCFEQTSSTTYPNIMVLRYLRANHFNKPEIERRALDYIARGYQRLLGFEVGGKSGGFSLFGHAPASTWLTAYGLMEFTDMAEVYPVDPVVLERMRAFLRTRLKNDGSFDVDPFACHEHAPPGMAGSAYVVMAMGKDAPPQAVEYLRGHIPEIKDDPYLCAITANALLNQDRATAGQMAGKLRGLAQINAQTRSATLPAQRSLSWGYGETSSVEASALGALTLLESAQDMELARGLLAGIQSYAGRQYGWGSTHATVLALRALERASISGRKSGPSRVVVEVNGKALMPIDLPAEETAVPVAVPIELPTGKSHLRVRIDGGPIAVCVKGKAYTPVTHGQDGHATISAAISYDSQKVDKGSSVLGTMTITSRGRAEVPMAEWGMPAGFEPDSTDLDALKAKGTLSRWEISGRTVRLYLPDMNAGQKVTINTRFYANTRGQLSSPAGRVYEYYRSGEAVALAPVKFEVK